MHLFSILAQYSYHVTDGYFYGDGASSAIWGNLSGIGLLLILGCGILSWVVQARMRSSMERYSNEPAPMTGAETAERMLRDNGITDVRITSTPGRLTDHYNPLDKTVNLSEMVYQCSTVAAMAVAAHECGHAVQHAKAYPWLGLRSSLVPMVNIGSRFGMMLLMLGLILLSMGSGATVAWIGLVLFGTTTLFAFITLPVEFDASRRALAWLSNSGVIAPDQHSEAATALRWAAMTYVSAALSSLAMLLYYALIILGRSRRN